MVLTRPRFGFDRFEDKVRGVNLAVRVRIRNANCLAFVFKDQHMVDLFASAQLAILFLPYSEEGFDRGWLQFSEGETVVRTVANYPSDPCRWLIAINARRR